MARTTVAHRTLLFLASALFGCSEPDRGVIPQEDREFLEGWASRLAPSMVLPASLAPSPPDTSGIGALIAACDADPEYYLYFYGCLKDSIGSVQAPEPGCMDDQQDGAGVPEADSASAWTDPLTDPADSLSGTNERHPST